MSSSMRSGLVFWGIFILIANPSMAMIQDLYCGQNNCYDVLKVTREASKSVIAKAYRQLAKLHHPDRHVKAEDKEEGEEMFKMVATAYEVLKDEESRADYDYMLDHPEEYYRHYYHYYRRKMSPKVDVRIVVAVTIMLISIFQYYAATFRYSSAINYLAVQPKYRKMALEAAEAEGLLNNMKKLKKRNKEEIRVEEERIVRTILETKMDIKGGYAKPKVTDVVLFQLIFLPQRIYGYISWYFLWIYRFRIKNEPYGTEEKLYLIRKLMRFSEIQFEAIPEEEKEKFLNLELWIPNTFLEWKTREEEERKRKNAESARYKSDRRYMRKHGAGRMYFDD